MTQLLKIKDLDFCYPTNLNKSILHNINLELNSGDFLLIIGPNGGGKTTLLNLILNTIKPTYGSITLFTKKIGYLPQNISINTRFPITLGSMLEMAITEKISKKEKKQLIIKSLEQVDLQDHINKRFTLLSGGGKQRALLARALISNPDLLILDEPSNNIDIEGKDKFSQLLSKLSENMTIIMVSHELSVLPKKINKLACVENILVRHDNLNFLQHSDHGDSSHHCLVDQIVGIYNPENLYTKLLNVN